MSENVVNLNPPDAPFEDEESDIDFIRRTISEKKFGPAPSSWIGMEWFNEAEHAVEIRALAKGLTIREILDFYTIGQFDDLSHLDQHFFCVMYLKGKSAGIHSAASSLFRQMDGMQGVKASLEYLLRNGGAWQGDVGTESGAPKAIRIVVEE